MVASAIGIGSNLGDRARNVRRAIDELQSIGTVVARSRLYRTSPWGKVDQPDFVNAAAIVQTQLAPRELLAQLKAIEARMGRLAGERWGPRLIDLDILTYGSEHVRDADLIIPHPHLCERAFVLVPLADIDARYARAAAEVLEREGRETVTLMPEPLTQRVRMLAESFAATELIRVRIQDENDDAIELRRASSAPQNEDVRRDGERSESAPPPIHAERVKADLVGIFHMGKPPVKAGEMLPKDRELGYVEALGIRNAVGVRGGGRVLAAHVHDGQPVEYGQVLFEIDRV